MPTALPGISITQASTLLQEQDRIIKSFLRSKVSLVPWADPTVRQTMLRWICMTQRSCSNSASNGVPGITYEKLIREMDEKLQFPGLTNTWTMPVQNRLDMELTGIKTPVGLKIQGPNVEGHSAGRCTATAGLGKHP